MPKTLSQFLPFPFYLAPLVAAWIVVQQRQGWKSDAIFLNKAAILNPLRE